MGAAWVQTEGSNIGKTFIEEVSDWPSSCWVELSTIILAILTTSQNKEIEIITDSTNCIETVTILIWICWLEENIFMHECDMNVVWMWHKWVKWKEYNNCNVIIYLFLILWSKNHLNTTPGTLEIPDSPLWCLGLAPCI